LARDIFNLGRELRDNNQSGFQWGGMSNPSDVPKQEIRAEVNRYNHLPNWLKAVCLALYAIGILLAIVYLHNISFHGRIIENTQYYYLLFACFAAPVFLIMPLRRKGSHINKVPWYDFLITALVFGICIYFATQAWSISRTNWAPPPTLLDTVLAGIILIASLEGGRRIAGLPLVIICLVMGGYVLFAEYIPAGVPVIGDLWGKSFGFDWLLGAFAFGTQGMLGLPARVIGEILIGFLVFAGVLIASGGGQFFIDLALSLFGQNRGGPAKVAVIASGFFGSLSGSPMTNVVGTGSFTIPAMKRMGYPAHYAGAIEAVASTGGMIMPPIMGSVAFIMAELLGVPYADIMVAAFIPALLYYWGLIVQVDAYAARNGLKGLPREELPSVRSTLKEGWKYIVVLVFLVFGLIYMRWSARAPFYAAGLLLLFWFLETLWDRAVLHHSLSAKYHINPGNMMTSQRGINTLATTGNLITLIIGILLPIGLILIGINVTGSLTALVAKLNIIAEANVFFVLGIAVIICYLFGMVGMAIIPYIVLAVTLVPALVAGTNLNPIGLHLFLMYFLLVAGITPPVATTAFVAAAMAGSPPMRTAWIASRLAIVVYFVPFFFVFTPSLLLQGPIYLSLGYLALAAIGIWILGSGLEGYMQFVGKLEIWTRPLLCIGGLLFAHPNLTTTGVGAAIIAAVVAIILFQKRGGQLKMASDG